MTEREYHGEYIGPSTALRGKWALVRVKDGSDVVHAQFDDMHTGYGLGWSVFSKAEFRLDRVLGEYS